MKNISVYLVVLVGFLYHVQGFDLNCKFEQKHLNFEGYVQTCEVSFLTITNKNETVTSINGQTGEIIYDNRNNNYLKASSVGALIIDQQTVNFIPKGIEKFFPNLRYLKISYCNLKEIEKSDIEKFRDLVQLHLNDNGLVSLEKDLFENNPKIQYIDFNSNSKLKYVGENILDPLKNLDRAFFQSCGCINEYYTQGNNYVSTFKDSLRTKCPSLESIKSEICGKDFEKLENEISKLKNEILNLREENCQLETKITNILTSYDGNLNSATKNLHTALKKLDKYEVSSRTAEKELKSVNLTCVALENLKSAAKNFKIDSPDTVLEFVDNCSINTNSLTIFQEQTLFLPQNIAKNFQNLSELNVVSSGVFQIEKQVFEGLNLKVLNLSDNKIIEIPVDTFGDLKNLAKLDLSQNNIEKLENEVFGSLKILEILKLDQNKLVSINFELFKPLSSLKYLSISKNNLKFISANILTPLTSIVDLNFSENDCIDKSYPQNTLFEIENEIIDNCIAPIQLNCDFQAESDGNLACKPQNLIIEYPKTKISKVVGDKIENSTENLEVSDKISQSSTNFISKLPNIVASLIITGQSTKFLPYQISTTFPKLTKIVVENSALSALHKHDFSGLSDLKTIEIRGNNITTIEEETFDDTTKIEVLDLSNNQIKSLPGKIFINLIHVRSLILSHNQLAKFTADLLPRKNIIEKFKIDNNELELIETKTLRYLRKAKLIDLTENICIDQKFDKSDEKSKTLVELSGEIDLNCSSDD